MFLDLFFTQLGDLTRSLPRGQRTFRTPVHLMYLTRPYFLEYSSFWYSRLFCLCFLQSSSLYTPIEERIELYLVLYLQKGSLESLVLWILSGECTDARRAFWQVIHACPEAIPRMIDGQTTEIH